MSNEHLIRLITLDEARRREGDRGRTTQWRERLDDPDYPNVIVRGRRRYLVESEHQAWLARLIERARRGAGPAKPERRARSSP
jgi:hypothetical protein